MHLLVRYQPKVAVSALVNSLKGVSTRWLRLEFTRRVNLHITHGHLWSPSYSATSCSGAALCIIRQYIDQQRHRLKRLPGLPTLKDGACARNLGRLCLRT